MTPRRLREVFEVNFFGAVDVADEFAPVLQGQRRGALLNVLSVLSWLAIGDGYSATKAALWSASNTQRLLLAEQRRPWSTSLYLGYTDTPMTANVDAEKNDPADVVAQAYAGWPPASTRSSPTTSPARSRPDWLLRSRPRTRRSPRRRGSRRRAIRARKTVRLGDL